MQETLHTIKGGKTNTTLKGDTQLKGRNTKGGGKIRQRDSMEIERPAGAVRPSPLLDQTTTVDFKE